MCIYVGIIDGDIKNAWGTRQRTSGRSKADVQLQKDGNGFVVFPLCLEVDVFQKKL